MHWEFRENIIIFGRGLVSTCRTSLEAWQLRRKKKKSLSFNITWNTASAIAGTPNVMWVQNTARWRGLPLGHLQLLLRKFLLKPHSPFPHQQIELCDLRSLLPHILFLKVSNPLACSSAHTLLRFVEPIKTRAAQVFYRWAHGAMARKGWGRRQNWRTLPPLWRIYHLWTCNISPMKKFLRHFLQVKNWVCFPSL